MKIYPVILSGGTGTRLWPLSRATLPKQYQALASEKTMLQETAIRLQSLEGVMRPLIVCANEHRFLVAEQMSQIGIQPLDIILEPQGKNTAPAAAVAARYLRDLEPEALMLIMPADHVIQDVPAFLNAARTAAIAASHGALVTFGIKPTAAETGYGYIRRGAPWQGAARAYVVDRFVEKPNRTVAEEMVNSKEYSWNSGMFMFLADQFLKELQEYRADIASASTDALDKAKRDLDFCRLDAEAFAACPSESIDYAVMERTRNAVVIESDIGWSDVGSWQSLADAHEVDANRNVLRGDVYTNAVEDTYIHANERFVAAIGVKDLVVVETKDAVLVAHKDHSQDVKGIVDDLKRRGRSEYESHTVVYRPWGSYESVDAGERFQVKRITVKPGEKLSLQMHHHRAEHWIVVSGTARVTCGDRVELLSENQSTYIPIGEVHRLENPGKLPLHLIEVQSGSYLGEDDIVRLEDIYQRA